MSSRPQYGALTFGAQAPKLISMTTTDRNCPDCVDERGLPTGQIGMYQDGTPRICWTCDGTGIIASALAAEIAVSAYRVATGFSLWENDGDTWIDTSSHAVALREAYWTTRGQS